MAYMECHIPIQIEDTKEILQQLSISIGEIFGAQSNRFFSRRSIMFKPANKSWWPWPNRRRVFCRSVFRQHNCQSVGRLSVREENKRLTRSSTLGASLDFRQRFSFQFGIQDSWSKKREKNPNDDHESVPENTALACNVELEIRHWIIWRWADITRKPKYAMLMSFNRCLKTNFTLMFCVRRREAS